MKDFDSLTVGQVLERAAEQVPDKTAVVDGDRRKTYKELNSMVDALAIGISEIGFKKGDRVAIYMKNSLEFVVAFYALQKLGLIAVWINPIYRMHEAKFVLKNSEVKGAFIFSKWEGYNYLEDILEIKNELPELETIIVAGPVEGQSVYPFNTLIDQGAGKTPPVASIDPQEDLSMMLYTSGTTGKPKGAMIDPPLCCGARSMVIFARRTGDFERYFYRLFTDEPLLWLRLDSDSTHPAAINRCSDG
jgi:acyl-CoA synthetase (AMP-forming)/AMP-acid ligase II